MQQRPRSMQPAERSSLGWAEIVRELAEVHRARRAVGESSRWPLAHACSRVRRNPRSVRADDAASDACGELDRTASSRYPFCCRALG